MNIQKFYQKNFSLLKSAKIPNPENETWEIFCEVLKKDKSYLLTYPEKNITKKHQEKIDNILKRRLKNEPLAYILGHKNFYGLDFIVNKNILIPRPETELMVEKVLVLLRSMLRNKKIFCIDIGTGSSCIVTSIAKNIENKNIKFIGLDISLKALSVAKKNAQKHKVSNQIKFIQSDLLKKIILNPKLITDSYQLIILANLPYLSNQIYQSASKSVTDFEPQRALISGKDGLDHYRKLLDQIKFLQTKKDSNSLNHQLPASSYKLFLEISPEQKELIKKEIIKKFPQAKIKNYKDLAQKWRLVEITF